MKLFGMRIAKGRAVGAQAGFADAFNRVLAILENIEGTGRIEIDKSNPEYWRIKIVTRDEADVSGGGGAFPPEGWSEQDVVTVVQYDALNHKLQIKKSKALVKDGSEGTWTDVVAFWPFDA